MKIKRYIPLAAVTLGLVGSFFLPNAVASIIDARSFENLILIDAPSISFEADMILRLPERVALASSPGLEILALSKGQALSTETAQAKAIQELARFFGDSPFGFSAENCIVDSGSAALLVDPQDPSGSMIIWEFKIHDPGRNEATVIIDDDTGTILKLIYQQGSIGAGQSELFRESGSSLTESDARNAALLLSEIMTAYYDLPVRLGDFQLSDNIAYYRADMYGGSLVVPMYGVVRQTGFTINERL